MPIDVGSVRGDFPILDRRVGNDPLVYLDNAATTQTPTQVREAYDDVYDRYNANVHRGIHDLSYEASIRYEAAHDRLAEFLGASGGREEIVFTKNTTESINLVAYAWGLSELGPGDEVVLTEMEHHASLVTWQQIAKKAGADVTYIRVDDDGRLDMDHAREVVGEDTAMVSVVHVSNVLGTINPVRELAALAHDHGARVLVDGAQAAPTRPVDVEAIDADFYTLSGHKMCGPTGIGVLYGKRRLLEEMDPFLYGGEMIADVTFEDATWNELPWKFEAGTPPIAEGIALAAAADYLDDLGMANVRDHENALAQYLLERLEARDDVETYGPPSGEERAGLVAFNVDGVHAHDLSGILNESGVAIRAGDHCTQPLHDELGISGSARASFYVYNTREEIDRLLAALGDGESMLTDYLRSDRFSPDVESHYERSRTAEGLADPTFSKTSQATTCGDEGRFDVEVDDEGVIRRIAFESESCAVSSATASKLSESLVGRSLEEIADLDGHALDLFDGQIPPLRVDCVEGPEEVIRLAAREYLDARAGE
ncbi:SufS family cysteine desulfurase [Halorientalis halophila]|uniref:SufS family cysteine desulfurase n=1 Tax=Halorientalis halophila TaxID=3108499 RepID=UPI003AB66FE3